MIQSVFKKYQKILVNSKVKLKLPEGYIQIIHYDCEITAKKTKIQQLRYNRPGLRIDGRRATNATTPNSNVTPHT